MVAIFSVKYLLSSSSVCIFSSSYAAALLHFHWNRSVLKSFWICWCVLFETMASEIVQGFMSDRSEDVDVDDSTSTRCSGVGRIVSSVWACPLMQAQSLRMMTVRQVFVNVVLMWMHLLSALSVVHILNSIQSAQDVRSDCTRLLSCHWVYIIQWSIELLSSICFSIDFTCFTS